MVGGGFRLFLLGKLMAWLNNARKKQRLLDRF